jgi:uncharacterized protein
VFIKIEDIGPDGLELSEPVPAATVGAWLGEGSTFSPVKDGEASADVALVGRNVLVRGVVSATLGAACARCLKDAAQRYEVPFTVLFSERIAHAAAARGGEEDEDGEEGSREGQDGEHQHYHGPIIELDEVLRDNLILNLPMAPLCADDCKGLCPVCGRDRNEGPCGCAETTSPLAAALKIQVSEGTITVPKGEKSSGTPKKKKVTRPPR